jgi:hypothetical protein
LELVVVLLVIQDSLWDDLRGVNSHVQSAQSWPLSLGVEFHRVKHQLLVGVATHQLDVVQAHPFQSGGLSFLKVVEAPLGVPG